MKTENQKEIPSLEKRLKQGAIGGLIFGVGVTSYLVIKDHSIFMEYQQAMKSYGLDLSLVYPYSRIIAESICLPVICSLYGVLVGGSFSLLEGAWQLNKNIKNQ